jgi:hypothetical protein
MSALHPQSIAEFLLEKRYQEEFVDNYEKKMMVLMDMADPVENLHALEKARLDVLYVVLKQDLDLAMAQKLDAYQGEMVIYFADDVFLNRSSYQSPSSFHLSKAAALHLSQRKNCPTVVIPQLTNFTPVLVRNYFQRTTNNLNNLHPFGRIAAEQLHVETAQVLAEKNKIHDLYKLLFLSPSVAETLVNSDEIRLPELQSLSQETAKILTKTKKLTLPYVVLKAKNILILSSFKGELTLQLFQKRHISFPQYDHQVMEIDVEHSLGTKETFDFIFQREGKTVIRLLRKTPGWGDNVRQFFSNAKGEVVIERVDN